LPIHPPPPSNQVSKAKSKKMSPTNPVEEEEKAEVKTEPRSKKEDENLGTASPKDISDIHLLPYNVAILDDLSDKMDDPGVPTISCLIGTRSFIKLSKITEQA
jgi:hypothetical protein